MPFASIHFLFLFLPAALLLFFIIPNRTWRNTILVLASLIFFAWSDLPHLPLLVGLVLVNYLYGILIGRSLDRNRTLSSRIHMGCAVAINVLVLGFYKYLGFFAENFRAVTHLPLEWTQLALPLGISYFTFSAISYIVDVYNGVEQPERNIIRFSAYLVMFPKLMQGPITRLGQVKNELLQPKFIPADVFQGVRRFITGLAKKVILADSLAVVANKVFSADPAKMGADVAWYGLIAFTLQVYFDFSGYTDMAIGLGKIFGLKLPENFNYPYISRSITDFWRRWHMSLTSWFRTYIFIPLEFTRRQEKYLRQQSNLLIVFLLTGLWHGANWNFILWGIYFGLILAIESSGFGKLLKRAPRLLQHVYAIALIMLGWIFFRITSIHDWGQFLGVLFGSNGWTGMINLRTMNILFYIPILVVAVLFSMPVLKNLEDKINLKPGLGRILADVLLIGLFIVSICYILINGFQPFMYAQF